MNVRIASTRAPKVRGVRRAFEKLASPFHFSFQHIQFHPLHTSSGVSDTPKSIQELLLGAKQRAEAIFNSCDVSIGVEGGIFQVQEKIFLQSWSCVYDGTECYYGSSGAVEIPQALSHELLQKQRDLGEVIDLFAEQHDVRSNQGTFGILTNDIISREDSFELATIMALMPYFNKKVYTKSL